METNTAAQLTPVAPAWKVTAVVYWLATLLLAPAAFLSLILLAPAARRITRAWIDVDNSLVQVCFGSNSGFAVPKRLRLREVITYHALLIGTLILQLLVLLLAAAFMLAWLEIFLLHPVTSVISETALVSIGGVVLIVALACLGLLAVWQARARVRALQRFFHDRSAISARIESLTQSRRAIVDAFEIERNRISRDLHDGAQQFLVAANMKVGEAALLLELSPSRQSDPQIAAAADLMAEAALAYDQALAALRRTVSGLHPKVLEDHGLAPALEGLIGDCPITAKLHLPEPLPKLPLGIATTAYFVVSELLTNAAKYAPDASVSVLVTASSALRISVIDTGPGGAQIIPGRGLAGLRDRAQAIDGDLQLNSPQGGPTTVLVQLPLPLKAGESGLSEPIVKEEINA